MRVYELLTEVENNDIGRYDPTQDEISQKELGDSRPTLTLAHLNKLKKIRATRKLEFMKKQETLKAMYGKPKEEAGGAGGGPFG